MPWLPEEWVATPFAVLRIVQTEYGVAGAAGLEGAGLLQVLAFEEELGARELVDEARGKDGRSVDVRPDALMRDQHIRKGRNVHRIQLSNWKYFSAQ